MQDFSNVTTRLIAELQARDRKGFAKYGTTLDRTDLTTSQWLQHAKEEALDFACYLEKLILLEQSGENTTTPLSTKSPQSNAEELTTKEDGQAPYDVLAASLFAQHQAFEAHEIRRIWRTLYQLPDGSTLCRLIKNAIESEQGIEYLKPDADPLEKLNAIKVVGRCGKEALQTIFEACGHKVKFVEVMGEAETKNPA